MSQVIAGIYEIEKKIGAGGGGIVYLGRHLRLEKQVVLKADKRTLSTGAEILRREVDMLKNLSHTYIPQVYDFVEEDGVVYTVMDYIEGESLDKLLGRNQLPTQPQVIKWACQLLEALSYLHSRPPHGILHGDIKPANIMLRPNGDVCLIDFNIALALGEDGAVKVGFSRGYASPEHYGADYISNNSSAAISRNSSISCQKKVTIEEKTQLLPDTEKTQLLDEKSICKSEKQSSAVSNSTSGKRGIMLDVRSDVYSLGATLYHLISGHRPAEKALEVIPLGIDVCSPSVSAIIQKAMAPKADSRYQSAEEMLAAFLMLHQNDQRVIHHKKHIIIATAMLSCTFLLGGISSFIGLKRLEQYQRALSLAEYSANALEKGDVSDAVWQAMEAIPEERGILNPPVTAQAQKALTNALGVYDLADGFKALDIVELPSAPFDIEMSPNGTRFAAVYAYELAIFEIENQKKIATLPIQKSALSDVVFLDENNIIYAGDKGITAYDLSTQTVLWTGETATTISISADHMIVAAVNRDDDHAVIYRVSDGKKITEVSFEGLHLEVAANDTFADPKNSIFALNSDGSMLAVSFYNGGLTIFDLTHQEEKMVIYEETDYRYFQGGFYDKYFAFVTRKSGVSLFELIDTAEDVLVGKYDSRDDMLLQTDKNGIYLSESNLLVKMDPEKMEEKELAYTGNANITGFAVGEEYTLTATDDNCFSFFDSGANLSLTEKNSGYYDFLSLKRGYAVLGNRDEPSLRLLKLEKHEEAQLLTYDARYVHDEARISQDGMTVMLFSCQNFRIYNLMGEMLIQVELPNPEFIYDQQFVRDKEDSWLRVMWYDGTVRCYSASNGSIISEKMGDKPSKDLYEEFYTDKYRIESSLHGVPEVYDIKSGKLIATLEEDDYLTYVTQIGEYIITEYVSTSGERYGLLLDDSFQTLAYLPRLCDVRDDMLVFDYESGNLRQCRLYSLKELIAFGEAYISNMNERRIS